VGKFANVAVAVVAAIGGDLLGWSNDLVDCEWLSGRMIL